MVSDLKSSKSPSAECWGLESGKIRVGIGGFWKCEVVVPKTLALIMVDYLIASRVCF